MARIVFACYHQLELGTIAPVAEHLTSLGHTVSLLALVENPPSFDFPWGRVFQMPPLPAAAASEAPPFLASHILGRLAPDRARHLLPLLVELNPSLRTCFPFRPKEWVPLWRRFVESSLDAARPDVVVISVGQFETPLVRRICLDRSIPCLYQLVPFYEFKTVERLSLAAGIHANDEFLVAGDCGVMRLHALGVPLEQITITGAPLFDTVRGAGRRTMPSGNPRLQVLCAEQEYQENQRLRERLLAYAAMHADSELVIRPHPSTGGRTWDDIDSHIQQRGLGERVRTSTRGRAITDDLATASVLVTISSLSIIEAVKLGVPVVCWHPSFLPPETSLVGSRGTQIVHDSPGMYAALDAIREARDKLPDLVPASGGRGSRRADQVSTFDPLAGSPETSPSQDAISGVSKRPPARPTAEQEGELQPPAYAQVAARILRRCGSPPA